VNSENKPIIILIIVLISLFLCCCVCAVAGSLLYFTRKGGSTAATVESPQISLTPVSTPAAVPNRLDPELMAQFAQIEKDVSTLKGLQLATPLKRESLSTAQLEEQVTTEFFKDYTPENAAEDVTTLSLLGLLPENFDLLEFYKKLYTEQIAGYYDNETKSMYVVADQGFGGMERSTYAHEFTHALQDATYNFKDGLGYSDAACEKNSEYCAAIQSLIEGDATNTQMEWLTEYATSQDIKDLQSFMTSFKSPVLDSAPAYMQEDMGFPYTQGSNFVKTLLASGGEEAINTAFTSQRPVSTEQIMHPSRYPDDKPVAVSLPELANGLGADWQEIDRETIGEWYTWLILARANDDGFRQLDSIASAATEGWGGDQYAVLSDGKDSAFVVSYRWDTSKDSDEAYKAFLTYTQLRFGAQNAADIACKEGYCSSLMRNPDQGFTWIISTSSEAVTALQSSVRN